MGVKPNFLFIGPDKTGSSWLHEYFRKHPEAFVPDCKDIYYFDRYFNRGLGWYLSFFEEVPAGVVARGEISHDYILSAEAARRILETLPNVRLIASVRDPVERSFSHYLYLRRSGLTRKALFDAVRDFPEIVENSRYARLLRPYLDCFGRERLLVLKFADLREDPQKYGDEVSRFLGLSKINCSEIGVVREASRARSALLARAMKWGAHLARDIGKPQWVGTIKHSRPARALYKPYTKEDKPRLTEEERRFLCAELGGEAGELEELLGVSVGKRLVER